MNASEVYEKINENGQYNYFGLRAITMNPITREYETLSVGDEPVCSYVWDDGNQTDEMLRGTCALVIDRDAEVEDIARVIEMLSIYDDRAQIVLIGSYYMEYGQDEGEIIMYGNATVLGEWKK